MAVIDLATRITNDWDKYEKNVQSSDSYIFISAQTYKMDDGPASVDLTIGDTWYNQDDGTPYSITEEGIILHPLQTILIETGESIALPYNVFGIVTGKGTKIYQGTFISAGKINPGFRDRLKIGIYNGSKKKRVLRIGEMLCTCVFFEMESNLKGLARPSGEAAEKIIKPIGKGKQFWIWMKANKAFIVSIIAVIIALSNLIFNKNFIAYKDMPNRIDKVKKTQYNDSSRR